MPFKTHDEYTGDDRDDDNEFRSNMNASFNAQMTAQLTQAQAQMALSILQLDALNLKSDTPGMLDLKVKAVKYLSDYLDS